MRNWLLFFLYAAVGISGLLLVVELTDWHNSTVCNYAVGSCISTRR